MHNTFQNLIVCGLSTVLLVLMRGAFDTAEFLPSMYFEGAWKFVFHDE